MDIILGLLCHPSVFVGLGEGVYEERSGQQVPPTRRRPCRIRTKWRNKKRIHAEDRSEAKRLIESSAVSDKRHSPKVLRFSMDINSWIL